MPIYQPSGRILHSSLNVGKQPIQIWSLKVQLCLPKRLLNSLEEEIYLVIEVVVGKPKQPNTIPSENAGPFVVNDTGLQTRAGKRHGYARVRVRVHKAVPVYPYG
jgi:hypothetical protein